MKKALTVILLCVMILSAVVLLITAYDQKSEYKAFSELLNIRIEKKNVVSDADTHGGFLGDGSRLIVVKYDDNMIESAVKGQTGWHALPCSDNLNTFIYQPYDPELDIPEISNGYYFFYDRHSEAQDHYSDSDLLSRHSLNFTFAIYDSDLNRLYICLYDT